ELIEARSLDRARNAIRGLMDLAPPQATVMQADGRWLELDVQSVNPGDVVRVRPGERIGLDGEVISGSSTVNQAPITGESLPVEKRIGDQVFAGTINEAGSLEFRVSAAARDTTLDRKSTRLNSSHVKISYAVFCLKTKNVPTRRVIS